MKKSLLLIITLCWSFHLIGQQYYQTVRGTVIDKETHVPVEFANVTLSNGSFQQGTITDGQGYFKFGKVPTGRVTLKVSFVGYETKVNSNLEVTTGKELVLKIELIERLVDLDEVQVKAYNDKEKSINTYAPVSARMFSVEESQRYAGSMNDVSRMAMNFAGVKLTTETTNEIVIRGNSPAGVLFRLEGVDIPNPTHFGDGGNTGGPMSMLNNNVLANSDFLTGAFPAEYGNALSGVFDLRLRNGNNENHEFIVQTGLMGIELGAEGPISKENKASYLISYRHTNSKVMKLLGVNLMGTAQYSYEDLTFKIHLPTSRFGNFSIFGLGGKSYMKMFDSERDTTKERQQLAYESDYEMDLLYDNYTGVIGISHSRVMKNDAYTRFIISASNITNYNRWDSLSTINREKTLQYFSDISRTKYMAKFYVNKKFNSKNTIRTGISAELQQFSMIDSLYDGSIAGYRKLREGKGHDFFPHGFVQFQHRFNTNVRLHAGMSVLGQNSVSFLLFEPRLGVKWNVLPGQTISVGYGLHSMSAPIELARQYVWNTNGTYTQPNKNLGFTKSHHLVLGYDWVFKNSIRFKSEVYYQSIYDAVVSQEPGPYSLLNRGSYTIPDVEALNNKGRGENYGIEFTVEKFMDKGMYFLSTLSLYESKYQGSDGIWRDNAFNSNYVFNLLGGKEFIVGKKRKGGKYMKKITVDGKLNWAGGQRYTPVDLEASRNSGITVFDGEHAYANQLPDYFRIDARIGFKWIGSRSSQELAMDIRNLTNRENPFYIKFDPETGGTETKGFGMMPELLYRISF